MVFLTPSIIVAYLVGFFIVLVGRAWQSCRQHQYKKSVDYVKIGMTSIIGAIFWPITILAMLFGYAFYLVFYNFGRFSYYIYTKTK